MNETKTNKTNLLILGGRFELESGGIENTSYLFADYFRKHFNVYTLCTKSGCMPNIESVISQQSKYDRTHPLCALDFYSKALSIKEKDGLDYVLSVHFGYALCCVFLKWLHNIPYGVLVHGQEAVKWPKNGFIRDIMWRIFFYPMRWLILKNACDIFVNTNFTKGLIEQITNNRKITVINPPISFKPSTEEFEIRKDSFLLSIGRLIERKGFQNVIKALPKIKTILPNIKYYIGGSGSYSVELQQLVNQLGLDENVVFLGRVSEEDKCKLLSECSLFLMPSCNEMKTTEIEGFGLSLLEANSFGKFVIATYSGGIPEAVINGQTGMLVSPKNEEELADAIIKYFSPNFTYDIQICKDWAEKRFIGNIVEQYHQQIMNTIKV